MSASRGDTEPGPENSWSKLWTTLTIALITLIVYLLPLLAIAIDERVLKTNWIAKQFPPEARTVFFYVYPFLRHLE